MSEMTPEQRARGIVTDLYGGPNPEDEKHIAEQIREAEDVVKNTLGWSQLRDRERAKRGW